MVTDDVDGRVTTTGSDFTAAVQQLCIDEAYRRRLAAGARATARKRFDPVTNANRLWALIEARASAPRGPFGYCTIDDLSPAALYLMSQGWAEADARTATSGVGSARLRSFIRGLSPVAAQVEGGLVQWRNAFPQDVLLRWMSALWHEASGADNIARAEFAGLR